MCFTRGASWGGRGTLFAIFFLDGVWLRLAIVLPYFLLFVLRGVDGGHFFANFALRGFGFG